MELKEQREKGRSNPVEENPMVQVLEVKDLPKTRMDIRQEKDDQQIPLSDLTTKGACFSAVAAGIQSMLGKGAGKRGIYYVDTKGQQMFRRKGQSGFIGSLAQENGQVGGGTATLHQLPCSPQMMMMAAALLGIEQKLDALKETQQEKLDYLKAKDKAKLVGNVNTLVDVWNNYPYNCDNDTYKVNKHILVQDIRREAEQSIQLCREQIDRQLQKKSFLPKSDHKTRDKWEKIQGEFRDYQLALYLSAFSTVLETLLLENFQEDYLQSRINEMRNQAIQYREVYTECYNVMEQDSQSSIGSKVERNMASVSRKTGEKIARIPVVRKGPVDEALIEAGSKLAQVNSAKIKKGMNRLTDLSSDDIGPFIQSMETLNHIYNGQTEIYFDRDNLYLTGQNR